MAGATPPPSGVSAIGPEGQRVAVAEAPSTDPATRGRRNRGRRPIDPIANKGKRVDPSAPPPGSNRTAVDVREIPMVTRQSSRASARYTSVDGEEYSFRIRDSKGKPLESRLLQCLYLSVREQRLGGDPFVVFDAFKLRMEDAAGKVVYPPPHFNVEEYGTAEEEAPEEPHGFSLGD